MTTACVRPTSLNVGNTKIGNVGIHVTEHADPPYSVSWFPVNVCGFRGQIGIVFFVVTLV